MATNYRKYAENLIGNWNTDQYNAQKDVAKNTSNTNWQKIQNTFVEMELDISDIQGEYYIPVYNNGAQFSTLYLYLE